MKRNTENGMYRTHLPVRTQPHTEENMLPDVIPAPFASLDDRMAVKSSSLSVKPFTRNRTLDREALYPEFTPLVRRLLRQYGQDAELRKDLEGEIYCRFCALLDAFDPERGVPLRPY